MHVSHSRIAAGRMRSRACRTELRMPNLQWTRRRVQIEAGLSSGCCLVSNVFVHSLRHRVLRIIRDTRIL